MFPELSRRKNLARNWRIEKQRAIKKSESHLGKHMGKYKSFRNKRFHILDREMFPTKRNQNWQPMLE